MSEDTIGDAPIEQRYFEHMQALASGIHDILNGDDTPKEDAHTGFILLVFPFHGHEGRCNYISNAQRADVVTLLKEQLARFQGQPDQTGKA